MKPFTKRLALVVGLLFTALICMGIVYIDNVKHYWQFSGGFIRLVVNTNEQATMTVATNTGFIGFNSNNTARSFVVIGKKPATNASTTATSASTTGALLMQGGPGGVTTIPTTGTGGTAGGVQFSGGAGGSADLATTNATGGNGGSAFLFGGAGGAGSGAAGVATNAATGGIGGQVTLTGGVGGSPGAAATNTVGGKGGTVIIAGGTGGLPTAGLVRKGGSGADVDVSGGPGSSSTSTNGGDGGLLALAGGAAGATFTSGDAGKAGHITVTGGVGSTGSGGGTNSNGGHVFIVGGSPGSGAVPGNVVLNAESGGTVRGNTGIGTNFPVSRLHVRQEVATTNEVIIRQTWGATDSAVSTTNRSTIITNDWVLNQYYTNKVSRAWVYSSWTLQAGATDAAQLSIFIDRDGDGIPDATGHTIRQGVALTTANIFELSRMIPAGAAFVFTNQSGATATTPAVVNASCQWAND